MHIARGLKFCVFFLHCPQLLYYSSGFFCMSQNLQKMGNVEIFFICVGHLLRFKKMRIEYFAM